MTSRYVAAAGRVNGSIDMPLAAVAALAVGFAAFVMPDGILSRIVEGSGLPSILSAAQPPLGTTARAGVAAAAALATFGTVFMLLRMLGGGAGKVPRRERERQRDDALPFETAESHTKVTPKLRRADIHPDAPARRPILATREFGEPDFGRPAPAPVEAPPVAAEEPEPAPEPEVVEVAEVVEAEQPVPVLDELELSGPDIEMIVAAPEVAEAPAPPPAPATPAVGEPAADASISDLMARLERGLARRVHRTSAPEQARAPEPEARPVFQPAGDDRLRSAIENLQKMAARAG
ncbi:MAG TPA: hypothetical protein VEZ20_04750 [Allosphingosinicella sp.]|nr:hypothetical protein [Allosphingosinicella sp.]